MLIFILINRIEYVTHIVPVVYNRIPLDEFKDSLSCSDNMDDQGDRFDLND